MPDLAAFSRAVASDEIMTALAEEIPLPLLGSLEELVRTDGTTAVHGAIRETILRLAETHILANPRITRLIDLWDGIVGTARERIEGHLTEMLGVPPAPELVTHVFRCLSGSAARRGRHSGEHEYQFEE